VIQTLALAGRNVTADMPDGVKLLTVGDDVFVSNGESRYRVNLWIDPADRVTSITPALDEPVPADA
jgi:hypothetical protein